MTTNQTEAPIQSYSLQASNRSAREIARIFEEDGDLSPEYQRTSVWLEEDRILLVRSWLMGVPIPAIVINDRIFGPWPNEGYKPKGGFSYAVIDGKQRIETARLWFNGELAIPASWLNPNAIAETVETDDGPYVYYTGLVNGEQVHQALNFKLPTVEAKVATIQEEAEIYLLLNSTGAAHTTQDLVNAARVINSKVED